MPGPGIDDAALDEKNPQYSAYSQKYVRVQRDSFEAIHALLFGVILASVQSPLVCS